MSKKVYSENQEFTEFNQSGTLHTSSYYLSNANIVLTNNNNKIKHHYAHNQKRLQKNIYKYSLEEDKKYRGPLNLFTLRILAWLCIVLSQVAIVFELAGSVGGMTELATAKDYISIFSSLSMPFFLLANFAYIIQNKESILRILFTYLFMMLVIAGVFYLLYLHYIVGLYAQITKVTYDEAYQTFSALIMLIFNSTFKFNIFVDLFICTLFVYLFLGKPKKLFKGKKIIIFRLFTIIPIGYELATIILKILSAQGILAIPFLMTPFMPTKCPLTFIAFILIVIFEAKRKRDYYKYNRDDDNNYDVFFASNKNSWMFAKSAAKSFGAVGLLDLLLYIVISVIPVFIPDTALVLNQVVNTLELGESMGLLLLAPFVLLFSYNRMFKPSKMDIFLPALALILIVVLWLETLYQGAGMLLS